jgi:hypothetical protein
MIKQSMNKPAERIFFLSGEFKKFTPRSQSRPLSIVLDRLSVNAEQKAFQYQGANIQARDESQAQHVHTQEDRARDQSEISQRMIISYFIAL